MCPIYEYQCSRCGEIQEDMRSIDSREEPMKCITCIEADAYFIVSAPPGRLSNKIIYHPDMKPSEFVRKNSDHRD